MNRNKSEILSLMLLILLLFAGCASAGLNSTGVPGPSRSSVPATTLPVPVTTMPAPTTTAPVPTTTVPRTIVPVPSTAPQPVVSVNMELSPSLQQAISDLWFAVNGTELDWEATNNNDEPSVQFHGSFNGKHILVTIEDVPIVGKAFSLDVGYCVLWKGSCPFQVYVCYEDKVITMKEAHDINLFSDEEVEAILDYLYTVFPDE